MRETPLAAGTPPGPRWGSLQRSPDLLAGGLPPPRELYPRSRPFGPPTFAFGPHSLPPQIRLQKLPV